MLSAHFDNVNGHGLNLTGKKNGLILTKRRNRC